MRDPLVVSDPARTWFERSVADYGGSLAQSRLHIARERVAIRSRLYCVYASCSDAFKFGVSLVVEHRLDQLRCAHACDLQLVGSIPERWAPERLVHQIFHAHRLRGEWFKSAPRMLEWLGLWPFVRVVPVLRSAAQLRMDDLSQRDETLVGPQPIPAFVDSENGKPLRDEHVTGEPPVGFEPTTARHQKSPKHRKTSQNNASQKQKPAKKAEARPKARPKTVTAPQPKKGGRR